MKRGRQKEKREALRDTELRESMSLPWLHLRVSLGFEIQTLPRTKVRMTLKLRCLGQKLVVLNFLPVKTK